MTVKELIIRLQLECEEDAVVYYNHSVDDVEITTITNDFKKIEGIDFDVPIVRLE